MRLRNQKKQKGFTLVELLLVMAIIGLLASIILIGTTQARMAAQDQRTIADLENMNEALTLYYNDNGSYPDSQGTFAQSNDPSTWLTTFDPSLVPNYLNALRTSQVVSYYYLEAPIQESIFLSDRTGLRVQACIQPKGFVLFAVLLRASDNNTNSLAGGNPKVFMLGSGVTQGSC